MSIFIVKILPQTTGIDWIDISSLLKTDISWDTNLFNEEFRHVRNQAKFSIAYDSSILTTLLNEPKFTRCEIWEDGVKVFNGSIIPNLQTTLKQGTNPIDLTVQDHTELLDFALQTPVQITSGKLCNPANHSLSLVHQLVSLFTDFVILINEVDTGYVFPTLIIPAGSQKVSEILDQICFEQGYQYYFDPAGYLCFVKWNQTLGTPVGTILDSAGDIIDGSLQINQAVSYEDSVQVNWNSVTHQNDQIFVTNSEHFQWTGVGSSYYFPSSDGILNLSASPKQNDSGNTADQLTVLGFDPIGLGGNKIVWNSEILLGGTVSGGGIPREYPNAMVGADLPWLGHIVAFHQVDPASIIFQVDTSSVYATYPSSKIHVWSFFIEGMVWYKGVDQPVYSYGPRKIIKKFSCEYLFDLAPAQALADALKKNLFESPITYSFDSYTDFPIDQVYNLSVSLRSFSTTVLILTKSHNKRTRIFSYKARGLTGATSSLPTPIVVQADTFTQQMASAFSPTGQIVKPVYGSNLPVSTAQLPGSSGLYLFQDRMGYWDGSSWRSTINSDGSAFFSGTIVSAAGEIGGFSIGANILSADGIEINSGSKRITIFDPYSNPKVAMGYLSGLPMPGGGVYDTGAFGLWVDSGNVINFNAALGLNGGLVSYDQALDFTTSAGALIARIGVVPWGILAGTNGFSVYDGMGHMLGMLHPTGIFFDNATPLNIDNHGGKIALGPLGGRVLVNGANDDGISAFQVKGNSNIFGNLTVSYYFSANIVNADTDIISSGFTLRNSLNGITLGPVYGGDAIPIPPGTWFFITKDSNGTISWAIEVNYGYVWNPLSNFSGGFVISDGFNLRIKNLSSNSAYYFGNKYG